MARNQLRSILRRKQEGRCCYCGVTMLPPQAPKKNSPPHPDSETLEHLRRLIDGGSNRRDNLALSCWRCNNERGAMDWFTYATYRRGEFWLADFRRDTRPRAA